MDGQQGSGGDGAGALTPEAVTQLVNTTINSALAAREKKWKREIADEMGKGFETVSKRLDELAVTKSDKRKKADGEEPDENSVQYKGLQRQMADLKSQIEERDRKLAEADQKQRTTVLREKVKELLASHGNVTNPSMQKAALALLVSEENRVRYDEDGQLVFYESPESYIDLETGIKSWLKTDEAKFVLPPTGALGSGSRPSAPSGQRRGQPQQPTEADENLALGLALVKEFKGIPVG